MGRQHQVRELLGIVVAIVGVVAVVVVVILVVDLDRKTASGERNA